mmetsp:Transcript_38699/g.81093  ORF Transcript_38699/g.81093 Transcript_38699/m.81093 type:complete len:241 (-) Transcript_38699:225-947(-)
MCQKNKPKDEAATKPLPQWLLGMTLASTMTIAYFTIPIYLLTAIASLILRYPTTKLSFLYATPMLLSLFIPPCYSRTALALLRPIVNYFDFEAIYMDETNVRNQMNEGKNYIFAAQPHGVLSYAGFCAAVSKPDDPGRVPTAVASVLLNVPLLKNLMGIFNLVDASASNMKRILKEGGNIKIYIGGIAELFKCCRTEERLYLKKRKGFIKLVCTYIVSFMCLSLGYRCVCGCVLNGISLF